MMSRNGQEKGWGAGYLKTVWGGGGQNVQKARRQESVLVVLREQDGHGEWDSTNAALMTRISQIPPEKIPSHLLVNQKNRKGN